MYNTIDQFHAIAAGWNGTVPRNRFSMMIGPTMNGNFPGLSFEETLACEQISIPGKRIETTSSKTFNISQNYPTSYELPEVTLTFVLFNGSMLKPKFESWVNSIVIDEQNEFVVAYKNEIVTDITLTQLDQANIPVFSVKLLDAFPNLIGPVDSMSGSDNDYQRLNVSFVYDKLVNNL